jgi:Rps23 Pro-64 3,4-dihydroxylase Tpa1-like proline 4-hydroxylase
MLQQPESGGELSLYDLEWENGQGKANNHENREVRLADGTMRNIENDEVQMIDPQKGDMILFAGGQIWHRVESVQGNRERITLGGFLSFNYEKDAVVYWS